MNEQEFLAHHGLFRNPFADEDAQTDIVFKDYCIGSTYHPAWSKVYGDPREPATSIVFGPKGSGKTALRLQLAKRLKLHNSENPTQRVFVIQYDDFNGYLGQLRERLPSWNRDKPDRVLQAVELWDHMDGMLCLATTQVVDSILKTNTRNEELDSAFENASLQRLDRDQKRDLLLLAACYDQSKSGTYRDRWFSLRRKLGYRSPATWYDFLGGIGGSFLLCVLAGGLYQREAITLQTAVWTLVLGGLLVWGTYLWRLARNGWRSWGVVKHLRVGRRDIYALTRVLMGLAPKDLAAQPLPRAPRTDDRYALLEKLQALLRTLGFEGMIVLLDRVDEPDLVNGQAEHMRKLVWPLLDNKLLKHPGLGIKMLLPSDLEPYIDRESREFHERARLDKQNVNRSFDWTGEALFDVVVARMQGCANPGTHPSITAMLDSTISEQRLLAAFQSLRTPRSLFRFLYKLVTEHCKRHRSVEPQFQISTEVFESTLAVHLSEQQRAGQVV
jgi:hypothetical protein